MEVKYRLIAEVLKLWRADPEERALAEALLYMTGLHLTDLHKMTLQEVENVLRQVIRRPEKEVQEQQYSEEVLQKKEGQLQENRNEQNDLMPSLSDSEEEQIQTTQEIPLGNLPKEELLQELNKRRGRKPKNEQIS